MEAPGITRQRRPFLAPIWLTVLLAALFLGLAVAIYRSASMTTVVVVRHAEKQFGTIEDPPLTTAGEERARRLAQLYGERNAPLGIRAVYLSDTRRAQMTAAPLIERLGISPVVVPGGDVGETLERVRSHRGEAVLVIGHSNTVPAIVEGLSGRRVPPMPDGEYSTIYVVSVPSFGPASVLRMSY